MKTITTVENEIKSLYVEFKNGDVKENKYKLKVEKLKLVKNYLLSKPNPGFVKSEKERIEKSIEILSGRYSVWLENNSTVKKSIYSFQKEIGITDLKAQLTTINYILS